MCWRRGGWWCGWSTPVTSSTCRGGPRPTSWMRCGCASRSERGMLRPSFVPPAQLRRLRDDTRVDALIKLGTVATDIFGVSGRAMLEAQVAGQRDPKVLAELARGRLGVKHAALGEALTGQFSDHHARLARILLDQIDGLTTQLDQLTTLIEEAIAAIPAAQVP